MADRAAIQREHQQAQGLERAPDSGRAAAGTVPNNIAAAGNLTQENLTPHRDRSEEPASQTTPTASGPLANKTVGRYQLIKIAGRGNMGVVYHAYDPKHSSDVAVKVCTTTRLQSDAERRLYRRLFLNEARTEARE